MRARSRRSNGSPQSSAADARVTLALLTGNIEPCARAKLEPLGLNRHFPFGAYGSDHEDRYRLPVSQ